MTLMHLLQQVDSIATLSLFVGIVPAFMGAAYALWPTESKLALMRPLSLASIFGGLSGFVVSVINLLFTIVPAGNSMTTIGLALLGVALVPLFVSFAALTVGWLLVALGLRRQA